MTEQSPNFAPDIPQALEQTLLSLLQQNESLKEHELMQQLKQRGYEQFSPSLEPLALFQAHFLLFHILYRLQDKWRQAEIGDLTIFTLEIRLNPIKNAPKPPGLVVLAENLAEFDPLKAYYLDFKAYLNTQEREVIELIESFWRGLATSTPNERNHAIELLNLPNPFSLEQLNQRYRQLAKEHHPDKGGDTQTFQVINQATNLLRDWLKQKA